MWVFNVKNVNRALLSALQTMYQHPDNMRTISVRGHEVIEFKMPIVTVYRNPWECVLTNSVRDANPFFHLMEAIWMLAGRNDVAFLELFNKNMKQFSDDGVILHGAYGSRWHAYGQLDNVVEMLHRDRNTRRAVISLYDPELDTGYSGVDLPCNDLVTFSIRDELLHMTVSNRSNDMVWGAYGANAVHFSVLQQYVAALLNVNIGPYYQVSNNFHVYTELYDFYPRLMRAMIELPTAFLDPYDGFFGETSPLFSNSLLMPTVSDNTRMFEEFCNVVLEKDTWGGHDFGLDVLNNIASPMAAAWKAHKRGERDLALHLCDHIVANDWAKGCQLWLLRRYKPSDNPLVNPKTKGVLH